MANRIGQLGCIWFLYGIVCVILLFIADRISKTDLLFAILVYLEAILFLSMAMVMRRWLYLRWVWMLGYLCWFSLLLLSLGVVGWMLVPTEKGDAISHDMLLLWQLPIAACFIGTPVGMLVWWNHLELGHRR